MFNNGGMVAPQPQPVGILGSSPSLIDTVSNDILSSDMGAGSLSMAQGGAAVNMQPSYVFNQGGVAKFAPGGVVRVPLNPMIPQPTYSEELLDNRSVVDIAKDRGDFLFKAMQERNRQMEPFKKEGDFLSRMYDKFYAPARLEGERAQVRTDKEKERQAGMTEIEEMPVTVFLSQIGAPDDVIKYYSETGNLPVGYREAFEKAQGGGTIEGYVRASPARGSGKAVATSIALPTDKNIPGESDFDSGMGNAGLTQDYLDEQRLIEEDKLRQGYLGSDYIAGMGAVGKSGPLQDQEAGVADDVDESVVSGGDSIPNPQSVVPGTVSDKKVTDMQGILPPKIKPSAPEKLTTDGFGEFGTEYDESVDPVAAKVAEILESSKVDAEGKEVPKTKQDYIKEFKEDMPEYEGMSEEEKGFTIMEAGLRVMAGKSPNAVANIAEGLKGISKEFVKDKKAKRVYDQQIDLSAAKYGLQNLAKDRASLAAEAKEGRQLFKKVFRVAPGKTYKLNGEVLPADSSVVLTVNQVRENGIEGLITETLLAKQISAQSKKSKAALDLIKGSVLTPDKFRATEKIYFDNVTRVGHNTATRGMLNQALVAISKNDGRDIVGGKAVMKDFAFRIANATGTRDQLDKILKSPNAKAEYVAWTNSATTKFITGIIMEGGKITEQERTMARELSGAIGNGIFDGSVAGSGIITSKLKRFADSLGKDTENRLNQMEVTEQNWTEIYPTLKKAAGKYGDYASGIKKAKGPIGRSGGNRAFIKEGLTWKNIVTRDADGNMTGLKKNWNK